MILQSPPFKPVMNPIMTTLTTSFISTTSEWLDHVDQTNSEMYLYNSLLRSSNFMFTSDWFSNQGWIPSWQVWLIQHVHVLQPQVSAWLNHIVVNSDIRQVTTHIHTVCSLLWVKCHFDDDGFLLCCFHYYSVKYCRYRKSLLSCRYLLEWSCFLLIANIA